MRKASSGHLYGLHVFDGPPDQLASNYGTVCVPDFDVFYLSLTREFEIGHPHGLSSQHTRGQFCL